MTGSAVQAINGAFLTGTFFCCRLVWGAYASYNVFRDMYRAIEGGYTSPSIAEEKLGWLREGQLNDAQDQTTAFMGTRYLPLWLASAYLASNLVLNLLNYWWFSKMVQTIRKRFPPPFGTMSTGTDHGHGELSEKPLPTDKPLPKTPGGKGSVKAARQRAEDAMNGAVDDDAKVQRGVYADGHKSVEVTGRRSVRSRRKA